MKIVNVETGRQFYGGAQQVIWLLRGLISRGVESLLVCTPHSAIGRVAADAGIPFKTLRCAGDLDFSFVWRLRHLLLKERPDVVHCHSRRGADFLGGQAAAMAGLPAVVSRRVDNPEPAVLAGLRYRNYRRVIAISEAVAAVLQDAGLEPERLSIIKSAVDVEQIPLARDRQRLEREFGIGGDEFAIAVVAQLIPRKGHRYALEALAQLKDRYPELRLVVFGTGAQEQDLVALARALGLAEHVRFAGFRPDLDDMLASFDLLVHPALREGLGVAMLKAAAARLPVVAFDAAGAREAVRHGETGLLVPPEDSAALAAAVGELLADPGRRQQLGAAGRVRMQREFSIERMIDGHLEVYEAVLNGGR